MKEKINKLIVKKINELFKEVTDLKNKEASKKKPKKKRKLEKLDK